jgi:hypothetical protein
MEPELLSRLLQMALLPRCWKIMPSAIFDLQALPRKKANNKNDPKSLGLKRNLRRPFLEGHLDYYSGAFYD